MDLDHSKENVVDLAKKRAELESDILDGLPPNLITNFYQLTDKEVVFIPLNTILQKINSIESIKKINNIAYGIFNKKIHMLRDADDFISFLEQMNKVVCFKQGIGATNPKKIFAAWKRQDDHYDNISQIPTYPSDPRTYYDCEYIEPKETGAIDELVSFFNPMTAHDADLIKSLVVTPAWSGGYGQKPAFVLRSDPDLSAQINTGKSTLGKKVAEIYSGAIPLSVNLDYNRMMREITPKRDHRIILWDNVKKRFWGNGDIESLITAPILQGHLMYVGPVQYPNHFTYIITINDPYMSQDMASRALPITLAELRRRYAAWEVQLDKFIKARKRDIIAEAGYILQKDAIEKDGITRFPIWESLVLNKVLKNDANDYIRAAQDSINADKDDSSDEKIYNKLLKACLYDNPLEYIVAKGSPEEFNWFVTSEALLQWGIVSLLSNGAGANGRAIASEMKKIRRWEVKQGQPMLNGRRMGRGYYLLSKNPIHSQVWHISEADRAGDTIKGIPA